MNFQLTNEQLDLRRSVREFAEREIAPHVMEWDEAAHFPLEIVKQLGRLGLMGAIFPARARRRGHGLHRIRARHRRALARRWLAWASSWPPTPRSAQSHLLAGTDEQKKRYLPKLASGEHIGAWALTEPDSGSDAGGARCSALRKNSSWVLNGTKTFITNGALCRRTCVVIAVTDRKAGTHGLSAFVVEKGTRGFRAGKKENKLGLRASDTSELIFEDCEIPAANLLGHEGQGFVDAMRVLDGGRISIAALGLGMAQGAYECRPQVQQAAQAVRQAHQRIPGHPVEAG